MENLIDIVESKEENFIEMSKEDLFNEINASTKVPLSEISKIIEALIDIQIKSLDI